MHAGFVPKPAVRAGAVQLEQHAAVSAAGILVRVELAHAPAFPFRISFVHAAEHAREVLGIIAACAGEDSERRRARVMRVAACGGAVLERLVLAHDALRLVLVRPEGRRRHERLYLRHPLLGSIHASTIAKPAVRRVLLLEPPPGIEPGTFSLRVKCSTN